MFFLQNIRMCGDSFGLIVIGCRIVKCELLMSEYSCVFRYPHPCSASIGKSAPLLNVCLDTVYPCSDCRSRSGRCAPMYSSCSFSLPLLSSPTALSFFLFFSLLLFYHLRVPEQPETQTLTAHRGIQAPEHSCAYSRSSTCTCITYSAALRDI